MKRRAFLTMLGLAPVVASARPQRPDRPLASGGIASPTEHLIGDKLFAGCGTIGIINGGTLRSAPNRYGKSAMVISLDQGRIVMTDQWSQSIDVKAKSGFGNWSRSL